MPELSIGWLSQRIPNMVGTTSKRPTFLIGALGICLVLMAIFLNIGWFVDNWRTGVMLILGAIFFIILIAGVALNTSSWFVKCGVTNSTTLFLIP